MDRARQSLGDSHNATPSPILSDEAVNGQWYGNDDYGYGDDGDAGSPHDQQNDDGPRESKRRRIARACDMCRKKKIKCDGKMPKCSHCENYKTECIFTQVERKRAPPKGAKYIEGLENRLGRMETLLRLSGLLAEDDDRTDLGMLEQRLQASQTTGTSQPHSLRPTPATDSTSSASAISPPAKPSSGNKTPADPPVSNGNPRPPQEVDALADQMCSLITNQSGETRYIGSSSGFSIFSPKGIQWVNAKTGDSSFERMIASAAANEQKWDHWRPEVFNDIFTRRVYKPLPPREECFNLLKDYFTNFNCMFPLYHEPTFMYLAGKHYAGGPDLGSGWWASLNVALAIAHRLRVMSNTVDHNEDEQAWGYLKNAMGVMTELTMRNTDLLSVQALLGMSLFLQGTPNPQPSFFLVSAAIRLSHSIGLHKRGSGFNLKDVESEQRKRVFWIAYLLDKDICLRSGRPPAQDDDDMNVDLPSEDPLDNIGVVPLTRPTKDGKMTMNLFRHMCTFAQIQSRVYKQLYSVKASRQSDGELLNTIGDLDEALENWKNGIPEDFRPEQEIRATHTALIVHIVVLHFAYYNCLTTIHRMSVHHGYWTRGLGDYALQGLNARPLNPRVFVSAALCVNAARTSISLIRYIPQGDYACVWLILYYPVSSLVTIFANILQNPQDARARSDLRLMSSVVSFLTMLEEDVHEQNGNVRRMLSVCSEFERIARVVLDKAEREIKGRGKRKQAERERERDRANGTISAELEDGKTLEQLQIETQAAYRKPVPTPSMRSASVAASTSTSSPGQQSNGLPPPDTSSAPRSAFNMQNSQSASMPSIPNGVPAFNFTNTTQAPDAVMSGVQPDMSQIYQDFPIFSANMGVSTAPGDLSQQPTIAPTMGTGENLYQHPFVPQDLWQMPMTLEWDWADMSMGSFTPGPFFPSDGYMPDPTQAQNMGADFMGNVS